MTKVAKLVCLDPVIVTAIVEGRQPLKLTPGKLLAADLPLAWEEQRPVLGFGWHPQHSNRSLFLDVLRRALFFWAKWFHD